MKSDRDHMTTAGKERKYSYSITESEIKVEEEANQKKEDSIYIDPEEYLDDEEYYQILAERRE